MAFDRVAVFGFSAEAGGVQRRIVSQRLYVDGSEVISDYFSWSAWVMPDRFQELYTVTTWNAPINTPSKTIGLLQAGAEASTRPGQQTVPRAVLDISEEDSSGADISSITRGLAAGVPVAILLDGFTIHAMAAGHAPTAGAAFWGMKTVPPSSGGVPVFAEAKPVQWFISDESIYAGELPWSQLTGGMDTKEITKWCEVSSLSALSLVQVTTGADFRERFITIATDYDRRLTDADFIDLDGVRYVITSYAERGLRRGFEFSAKTVAEA